MTLEELAGYIREGREIEFRLGKHRYFHSHDGEKYSVCDDATRNVIFEGSLEQELTFEFEKDISFAKAINCFCFDCIL